MPIDAPESASRSMVTEIWLAGEVPPDDGVTWSQGSLMDWMVQSADSDATVPPSSSEMSSVFCRALTGVLSSTRNDRLVVGSVRFAARVSIDTGNDLDCPDASSVTEICPVWTPKARPVGSAVTVTVAGPAPLFAENPAHAGPLTCHRDTPPLMATAYPAVGWAGGGPPRIALKDMAGAEASKTRSAVTESVTGMFVIWLVR